MMTFTRTHLACLLLLLAAFATSVCGQTPPPDYRFKAEVLAQGMPQPMELEVAPDGRIFFNEINGKLKIYKPDTRAVVEAGVIPVFKEQENGFLGFALDPAFATNQFIYLFYSPVDYVGARLSRFRMRGDQLDLSTETKILEFGEQRRDCCHHAGSVEFGPNGDLFISTGDNTHPGGDSEGYAPIDERPDRFPFDAQKSSANTHDLRGKILRIRPTAEGRYTIPDGNLFPKDGSKGRPEIFVMGCRNPWRMSVDARTGYVYWGEVGPDAGGDGRRGSRGYDEINQARRAGNFGWPYFVGNNFAYTDYNFATKTVGATFDPLAPTNASPNNTGEKILPPAQPAFIYWPYGASKEFPMLGEGGRTACAGPVFLFRPEFKNTGGFPEAFDNCLLFYDWQRPFMKWARLDSDSNLKAIEPFTEAVLVANDRDRVQAALSNGEFVIQRPVDSQFGADGCLYLLDYGETWGANQDARLVKISYQWGNIAPVAKLEADKTSGPIPLSIKFSAEKSRDHEGDTLQYQWLLHSGARQIGSAANIEHTFTNKGNFVVELKVHDGRGGSHSANLPIVSGNTPPEVSFIEPRNGDFFSPGEPIDYGARVLDVEDGSSERDDELFESKVFVSARFLRSGGKAEALDPAIAAMKQSDCFNCHALEQKIVGPSFVEIAARYKEDAAALEASIGRVIKGSSGVWGEVPMLPHESLHPDQVRTMVRWIYGIKPSAGGPKLVRGLSGSVPAPSDNELARAELEVSYTDDGSAPAAPLQGKSVATLRGRRIQAEDADEKHGLRVLGNFLGAINDQHYAIFRNINLAQVSSVQFRVASAGSGGRIELRAGNLNGPVLAHVDVQPTGAWDKWVDLTAPVSNTERTDIYIVFLNPSKGGLMNLDWVEFKP